MLRQKLAKHRLSIIGVRSAGTWAEIDSPADPFSIAVARRYGVDLSEHQTRVVTEDLLVTSDLVLTMTRSQLQDMRRDYPTHQHKMHSLYSMIDRDIDILDPSGRRIDDFITCAHEIDSILHIGFARILDLVSQ